ncbi:glycosyltransferase [Candidatus Pacearchaeota archaeon]|nr:glycosyltransferase [Candidatus Pacearchaeota archaeon]
MKIIVCTRDLDFGVGSVVKNELKDMDKDKKIRKVIVIGPKKLGGYSDKIKFEIINNIGRFFITKEPYFAFKCNYKIKEILKKEEFDRINLHFPIYAENFGPKLIIKFHRIHKAKVPIKEVKEFMSLLFHNIYSYFDYRTIKYSNQVLFVSRASLEEAKKLYPKFKSKFLFEPNKVDRSRFFPLSINKRENLKKQLGFGDRKKNLLYVGRLDPLKGIMNLIKTLDELKDPKLRLIIIGDGFLKNKVVKYPFVVYLGRISNEELYKYYNIADLFILPSLYENAPMSILEAKACECKILATNVGDNMYLLNKGQIYLDNNELKNKLKRLK